MSVHFRPLRRVGAAPLAVAGALALLASGALAGSLPVDEPAALGFSSERLAVLDARIQDRIDAGAFPGAVVMIARKGRIAHLATLGSVTENGPPMPEDAIFRIYSMTKPVTSVAAMMLVEEGRLDLGHPVHAYLPEYEEMTVAVEAEDGTVTTEPARRAMTIRDLLRHTSGTTYGFFGRGAARKMMDEADLENGGFSNREVARMIAALPLEHHPGEVWEYSRATDVLGAVIEVIEGKSLGEVFEERIFAPLGMVDSGFRVDDPADGARRAEARADDMNIGALVMFDPMQERAFESGGGGMVSTVHDYARFAQMMMNGGELDGVRILSPQTLEWMRADHLAGIKPGKYYLPGAGYGFGLGFGVRLSEGGSVRHGNVGEYYWGGAGGTYWFSDPAEEMFVIYMMQSPKSRLPMRSLLRNLVYGAMTE